MAIGDPYTQRDDLKDMLGITDASEDDFIDRCVAAAAQAIDNRSGYTTFWKTASAVTRTIDTVSRLVPVRSGSPYVKLLLPDGIADASGFSVAGYPTASLLPSDALARGVPAEAIKLPWGSRPDELTITAWWGWPSVPDDIKLASDLQSSRYYARRGSPDGTAGSAEWGIVRVPNLDPDVKAILEGGYINPGIA